MSHYRGHGGCPHGPIIFRMLMKYRTIAFVVLMVSATLGPMYAQRFGRFFIRQNEPPSDSEFVFARWQYSSGSGGWSICFNNDIGDFLEWIDQPQYALKTSAQGLKLGVKFVMYSDTH